MHENAGEVDHVAVEAMHEVEAVHVELHGYPQKAIAKLYQKEVVGWNDNI